jgi:hypothetical protein
MGKVHIHHSASDSCHYLQKGFLISGENDFATLGKCQTRPIIKNTGRISAFPFSGK